MKQLLSFCLLSFLLSCTDSNVITTKYDSGELNEKYTINADSAIHGEYLRYFTTGDLAERSFYKNGKLDSLRVIYFENGQEEIRENYDNGVIKGLYEAFYDTGVKKVSCNYEGGVLTGEFLKYYPSGELQEKVTMYNNEENGPFEEYYKSGVIKWKGTFRNGDNEFGLLENFDSSGVLIKKMMCDSLRICKTIWEKDVDSPQ